MSTITIKKDKYPATTPPRITNKIREFAEELGGEPHYVPYRPLPFAEPSLIISASVACQEKDQQTKAKELTP